MKLFLSFCLLIGFFVNGHADSLPVNEFDSKNYNKKIMPYSRFTVFNNPKPDKNGVTALAEITMYNEGIEYYIKDQELYINFGGALLFKIDTSTPTPQLQLFNFVQIIPDKFAQEWLQEYQLPHTDDTDTITLPCSADGSKQVELTRKRPNGPNGFAFYQVGYKTNGMTRLFSLEECAVKSLDFPPGFFAYCHDAMLYFDGNDYPAAAYENNRRGIFFCDLKENVHGALSAEPYKGGSYYSYNPVVIPGTDYLLYWVEGPKEKRHTRLMIRKILSHKEAKKLARETDAYLIRRTPKK